MKYAILTTRTIHIPGDERSRKCPGHGYPESTEYVHCIETFVTREKFDKWIIDNEARTYDKKKFTPIRYEELDLTVETSIKVQVVPKE